MKIPVFLLFLSLSSILAQGIATPPDKSIRKLDLYVRKKRLIDKTPNGDRPISIIEVPYVVSIIRRGYNFCVGSILSPTLIISAAHCVFAHGIYGILSNSSRGNRGIFHFITSKIIHPEYHPPRVSNDLVLLQISPAIDFQRSINREISLFSGSLPPSSHGTISGWGCHHINDCKKEYPAELRSITVPIISLEECRYRYHNISPITNIYVCTYFQNRQKCVNDGDSGAPLVVNRKLVGVLAWGDDTGNPLAPDVFMSTLHPKYREWIESHM